MDFKHVSVLFEECMAGLNIRPEGIYVDGTAGGAGHSCGIASKLTTGKLIAIDKDPDAIAAATARLAQYPQAQVVEGDFRNIPLVLSRLEIPKVDGVLLDLGVSSYQLDTAQRGFSYHNEAPLDMRMSRNGMSAYDVVNTYSHGELARILREYGEEKFAGKIASNILKAREAKPIETTFELVELIKSGIPAARRREGGHPAKRSFQAIRIEVNGELEHLKQCIEDTFDCLASGGRFAIITFHSLEDRIVKQMFAAQTIGCTCPPTFPVCVCQNKPKAKLITRKPVEASAQELEVNNRSRSAKLRVLEKI